MVYNIYTKGPRSNFDSRRQNAEKTASASPAAHTHSRVQRKSAATSNQNGLDGFLSFAVNMLVFEGLKRVTRVGRDGKSQKPSMRKSESFAAEIHTLASS